MVFGETIWDAWNGTHVTGLEAMCLTCKTISLTFWSLFLLTVFVLFLGPQLIAVIEELLLNQGSEITPGGAQRIIRGSNLSPLR